MHIKKFVDVVRKCGFIYDILSTLLLVLCSMIERSTTPKKEKFSWLMLTFNVCLQLVPLPNKIQTVYLKLDPGFLSFKKNKPQIQQNKHNSYSLLITTARIFKF